MDCKKNTSDKVNSKKLFRKNAKGDLAMVGSGRYFKAQKRKYAAFDEPCKAMYQDQIRRMLLNHSEEVRLLFNKNGIRIKQN